MKMTRRTLLTSAAAAKLAAAAQAAPQSTPQPAPPAGDALQRSAAAIARVPLPQLTEPAFSFKT